MLSSCCPPAAVSTGLSLSGLTGGLALSRTWQRNLGGGTVQQGGDVTQQHNSLVKKKPKPLTPKVQRFPRPVLHDLGFGYFFPELCELLRASVVHLCSHYQESVLWRGL